jgi:hypothetical protein
VAVDHRTGQNAPGVIASEVDGGFDIEGNVVAFLGIGPDGHDGPTMVTVP